MTVMNTKRQHIEDKPKVARSRIFQPFRAIGYITNDVPFVVENRGQSYFLTTSAGSNFQTYNADKMNLLFVGPTTESPITAMTSANGITYAACNTSILGYKRGKEVSRVSSQGKFSILQILVLGPYVAGLCDDNTLKMWNTATGELYTEIEFGEQFTATAMIHPSTYLNKILVSSTQGTLQIWNIRTNSLVYQFKPFGSPITCLTQSPVVDVIAVGMLDGTVQLHNIKVDERIDSVRQEDRVTAISFRTDEEPMMATANMHGDVALWDLNTRRLVHNMKGAHDASISSLAFLHGQPVLVTGGSDNAVKQWLFENNSAVPLPLKYRSGHYAPPSKIRFLGTTGNYIVSAGRDQSLRAFSIRRDAQSFEFSQGSLASKANKKNVKMHDLKLPQIIDFDTSMTKEKEWDNIATCHLNDHGVRTWTTFKKSKGKHTLLSTDKSAVKTTAISACGNFILAGCASGQVEMFNLQSGAHRKTFGGSDGHKKTITGVASDHTNRRLISASIDKSVKIWDFKTAQLIHTVELESPVVHILFLRENDLLAVACDDLGIRVIDVETQKVVREFWGHRNRITDMTFSPDGRWIVSSSLDATVRTWDLPSGAMVDIFRVQDVVTSLTFSPVGDYLATSHVDNVGIFLWANRTQFSNVSLHHITDEDSNAAILPLPSLGSDVDIDESDTDALVEPIDPVSTSEQLTEKMITLSLESRSKWQNLLNLDTIKQRNKPTEAPKLPEKAPFFLPTLPGAAPEFDLAQEKEASHSKEAVYMSQLHHVTEFTRLLSQGQSSQDFTAFVTYCKSLGPSAVDLELRSMTIDGELTVLNQFLEAIAFMLSTRRNFELAQAWLSVFCVIHGDLIVANPENPIHSKLEIILSQQQTEYSRLSEKIHYGLCLIDFVRKA
ncbi:Utp21 specific WD40 associated putative domain-containing protein [Spinellus fusiger]|nr:Utp21 specific WD40 associated putative domain-containing protein [Spinellus fusiger]